MAQAKAKIWCLHGAVGSAADWHPFRDRWQSAGYDFRAVDLWRFLDCCPRSMVDTAIALNAEVASYTGTNLLVGYSMGGRMGLQALLAENSPWDAAVIIAAHPGLESEREKSERRKSDAEWSALCHRGDWAEFLQKWQGQAILRQPSDAVIAGMDREPLIQRRKEISRSFVSWSLGAQENFWPRLPEIEVPVLWLTGRDDDKFTRLAQRACGLLPDARHLIVPAAGHRVPWQQPELFAEAVLKFFPPSDAGA